MEDIQENARVESVMSDPNSEAVAKVYSTAYLNAAGSRIDEAVEELESFVKDVLGKNAGFANLLLGGLISSDERVGMIDRTLKPFASEFFVNYLKVLVHHERLGLIRQIYTVAKREHEKRSGKQRVQIQSSQALDAATLDRIRVRLRETFQFEPILEPSVDPKLIGGLVIRVENSVYDGSLRSRLGQLAKRMHQRSLHEIQSGRDRFSHPEGD